MENLIAEDVAVKELKNFVEYHLDDTVTEETIKTDYPIVLKALMRGLLNIEDMDSPVLTLKKPITAESGNVVLDKITFHTRVPTEVVENQARGMDLSKDTVKFTNKLITYLAKLPTISMLYKIDPKFDYKVMQQMSGLFM